MRATLFFFLSLLATGLLSAAPKTPPAPKAVVPNNPRPRLFFCNKEQLKRIRARVTSGDLKEQFDRRLASARRYIGGKLSPEPPFLKPGPERNVQYKEVFTEIRPPCFAMRECALLYILTGDREIGLEAKRRLIHYAGFDPDGSTYVFHNDEPHMTIGHLGPQVFDWTYDLYTAEERKAIEKSLVKRIHNAHDLLTKEKFYQFANGSHQGHELGIIAQGCLEFAPEHPELQGVFAQTIATYRGAYPKYGKEDGGWNEGPSYWTWTMSDTLSFLTAVREATGINVVQERKFYHNTVWYRVYVSPPGHSMVPFGDGAQHKDFPTPLISTFARLLDNPELLWFSRAQNLTWDGFDVTDLVLDTGKLEPKMPTNQPRLRSFPGVGLVCSHTSLTNPTENVSFFFHSNPYGAISHAHNNQNAFALSAYGEALAICSGYYNCYGDPHHEGWTRTTRASCAISYDDGVSQERGENATGELLWCDETPLYASFAGSCAPAWGNRLSMDVRTVVRIYPDTFVICDRVAGRSDHVYEYNLHAIDKIETSDDEPRVTLKRGEAALDVDFLEPADPVFYQHTVFDPVPRAFAESSVPQFHLAAMTPPTRKAVFVTVLQPRRASETPGSRVKATLKARGDDREVRLTWADGRTGSVFFSGKQGNKPLVKLLPAAKGGAR